MLIMFWSKGIDAGTIDEHDAIMNRQIFFSEFDHDYPLFETVGLTTSIASGLTS